MSINDPLFVVALNYRAFLTWCERKGIAPHSKEVVYVQDVKRLMGQRDIRILFIHGWVERKDWREIYNRSIIVGRRPK